jgi:hypothetical protein
MIIPLLILALGAIFYGFFNTWFNNRAWIFLF